MYAASEALARAAPDYRWLLDSGYPERASLKLVGDRYALGREERFVLFRGVSASAASIARRGLLAPIGEARGKSVLADGYNQIYAVMHYLAGRPVFISSDGFLRDAGAAHGRVSDPALFERSSALLASALAAAGFGAAIAYFDAPVPFSAAHAAGLRAALAEAGLEAECPIVRSADFPLKAAPETSFVATGDSGILDALAAGVRAFDAARFAIELAFGPRPWLDLGAILE